jgi:hypothetical protein
MEVSFLRTTKVIKIATKGFSSLLKFTQEEASYMQEEKLLSRERKMQEEPPKHTFSFFFHSLLLLVHHLPLSIHKCKEKTGT